MIRITQQLLQIIQEYELLRSETSNVILRLLLHFALCFGKEKFVKCAF